MPDECLTDEPSSRQCLYIVPQCSLVRSVACSPIGICTVKCVHAFALSAGVLLRTISESKTHALRRMPMAVASSSRRPPHRQIERPAARLRSPLLQQPCLRPQPAVQPRPLRQPLRSLRAAQQTGLPPMARLHAPTAHTPPATGCIAAQRSMTRDSDAAPAVADSPQQAAAEQQLPGAEGSSLSGGKPPGLPQVLARANRIFKNKAHANRLEKVLLSRTQLISC